VESTKQVTSVGGYDEMAIDLFHEAIVELLESIEKGTISSIDELQEELNKENDTSDYCTWYLRVLTATYLKSDPQRFLPYLEDYKDIATFCQAQIEPMGKECTMVQVLALAEAIGVNVKIQYLDGREFTDSLTQHSFGLDSSPTQLTLLYRPGHYDILYLKDK
jgi:ubiquitin thioesterase protein OTUB1